MWTTLALLSSLSLTPSQSDLSLTHVRATHGLMGPQRENESLYPGDILYVCFDIEGITADEDGKVRYSTTLEVSNANGKVLLKQQPQNQETKMSLGGNRVPAFAQISVGLQTPPGEYGYKIRVKDLASGKEQTLSGKAKVLEKDFALVRAGVTVDVDGQYPVMACACGQGVWVQCSAVDFKREGADKQPNLVFEIRILNEDGKAVFDKPTTNAVRKDVPEKQTLVPMAFPLVLNRPGKFTVELVGSDQISGKKAKVSFPLTVHSLVQER
jgi:hypothetical protein